MKHLLSLVALGSALASCGLAVENSAPCNSTGRLCTVDELTKYINSTPKGCPCPSNQSKTKMDLALLMYDYCDPFRSPDQDKYYDILNAKRVRCGLYTFVNYGKESAHTVCGMIGLVPADHLRIPEELKQCARKCRYKNDRLCFEVSSANSECDNYCSYNGNSDSSDANDKKHPKCPKSCEWRHKGECAVLCKPHQCHSCLAPTLLTFDDGEDQTCDIFVNDGPGRNTVYRGFSIKNGGVYNPWLHRCEFAQQCTYQWDLVATVSKPQGLFNSNPTYPMSISRKAPFGLVSLFVTLSSQDVKLKAPLMISAVFDKKTICTETIQLHTGCPRLFRPKNQKAFSKVTKLVFQYDIKDASIDDAYIDIDNMLVCM